MPARHKPLWTCPRCGAQFVTAHIWHSCGKYTLEKLFSRSDARVLPLFKKFAKMVRSCGRVHMIPQKTRVVFMVRVRFAGAYPRKSHFTLGFALRKPLHHPRIVKHTSYGPHFHGHYLKIASEKDLDPQLRRWIKDSFAVGRQAPVR